MNFNRSIPIGQLMTTELKTLSPDDNLLKVEELFQQNDFHHIPIVDASQKIVGIISRVDFYKMEDSFTIFNTVKSRHYNTSIFKSILVSEIMIKQLATLHPEDTAIAAMGMFNENLFHAIPVVDKNHKLLGLVTTYDLLTYAYKEPILNRLVPK